MGCVVVAEGGVRRYCFLEAVDHGWESWETDKQTTSYLDTATGRRIKSIDSAEGVQYIENILVIHTSKSTLYPITLN